jgi:UTP--glucose-1-phosphate uridylyltransferase
MYSTPAVFKHLSAFETGAGGEIQLTDAMAKMIGAMPFHGVRYDGTRYDCGTKLGFIETNLAFALRDPDIGPAVQALVKEIKL